MVRLLTSGFLICVCITANSQVKEFYTDLWIPTHLADAATYYRIIEVAENGYLVRDYRVNGDILYREMQCSAISPDLVYHGEVKEYYSDGNLLCIGSYKEGVPEGKFIKYWEDGKINEEYTIVDKKRKYTQIWDKEGTPLLSGSFTHILTLYNDEREAYDIFDIQDSILIGLASITDTDTIFSIVEKNAEYKGGIEKFYKHISQTLRYPAVARRTGIQGRVYVGFIVEKDGTMSDIKVLKGIGGGCDEEAVRVFQSAGLWDPAMHREKPLRTQMVLPIYFQLR